MKIFLFTVTLTIALMGFSNAGFALEACSINGLPDHKDRPTQIFHGGKRDHDRDDDDRDDDRNDREDSDDEGDRDDRRKGKRPVANCTCKFPIDCEIPICQKLKQYKKKCDVSPS